MTSQEFVHLRRVLEKSQNGIAQFLGVSVRSIQAYEQGWRKIPPYIERMVLYLKCQLQPNGVLERPCWELKKCPMHWRDQCFAWNLRGREPCWFINGTFCEGRNHKNWEEKMATCRECSVFATTMGGEAEV